MEKNFDSQDGYEQEQKEYSPPTTGGDRPLAVVAMGGHAFMQHGDSGTIEQHHHNAAEVSAVLMTLVERDYNLVITHGNGPQVGQLLLQNDLTHEQVPPMPLDVLVADTEGWLGYVLQQALLNQLRRRNIHRYVVSMITQVQVDKRDPAFSKPTKPVGRFLSQEEAEARRDELGWVIAEDAGRGWRRVVPSPRPFKIVQRKMIRDAALNGHIVIAGGGGGIPIVKNAHDDYEGVEAVIDKDLTSSTLGVNIGAELLVILTDVDQVFVDYKKPTQRALGAVTMEEAERLITEGHFPAGSMGPKVEAIYEFLRKGGKRGMITNAATLEAALEGRGGTHFVGRL
ncbi:MAG: carbamate kinase [Deltaproteobacteria bacterium]|nr:carbamate kinase [Deltaproteobacteria bacterium]